MKVLIKTFGDRKITATVKCSTVSRAESSSIPRLGENVDPEKAVTIAPAAGGDGPMAVVVREEKGAHSDRGCQTG